MCVCLCVCVLSVCVRASVHVCVWVYMPQLVPSTRLLGQGWSQQGTTTLPTPHQPSGCMCVCVCVCVSVCTDTHRSQTHVQRTPLTDIGTICAAIHKTISHTHSYSNTLPFNERTSESPRYEPRRNVWKYTLTTSMSHPSPYGLCDRQNAI